MGGAPSRYDGIADFYDSKVGDDVGDAATAALLELAGEVRGLQVLDLACGQGRVARALARHGARVVGADLAAALLEKGRAAEDDGPLGIEYLHADVTAPDALTGRVFDGVVSNFALSDIADVDGALATVARVLRPGGWFVFSILHPCFPGWGADAPSSWPPGRGYHAEGWWLADNPGFRGKVGSHHRMLSTYLNVLVDNGLALDRVLEPEPGPEWQTRAPTADPVPVYLVVRARASSVSATGG